MRFHARPHAADVERCNSYECSCLEAVQTDFAVMFFSSLREWSNFLSRGFLLHPHSLNDDRHDHHFSVKMDVRTLEVQLCAWTAMSLLTAVFAHGELPTDLS